jgi:hypothetical protein
MTIKGSIMITGSRDVEREVAQALFEQHLSPFSRSFTKLTVNFLLVIRVALCVQLGRS